MVSPSTTSRDPGRPPLRLSLPDGQTTSAVYSCGRWRALPPLWGGILEHRRSRQPYILDGAGRRIHVTVLGHVA